MRKPTFTLLALTTLTIAASTPALAENAKGFADETRDNGQINLRYPGDKGYTVRHHPARAKRRGATLRRKMLLDGGERLVRRLHANLPAPHAG
jgi:hypothetical protein